MEPTRPPGFATLAVHAGLSAGAGDRSVAPADWIANLLARAGFAGSTTPASVLEQRLAALEGGTAALAHGGGVSSMALALAPLAGEGDEVIVDGSLALPSRAAWRAIVADAAEPETFEHAVTRRTQALVAASVAPAGDGVADIAGLAAIARRAGVPLIVDNTVATPFHCRPLEHGADIVVHASADFLGGTSAAIGGFVVDGGSFNWLASGRYPALTEDGALAHGDAIATVFGNFAYAAACRLLAEGEARPAVSAFDAAMVEAGLETLPLRLARQSETARAMAAYLAAHPKVVAVRCPGLPGDRNQAIAARYCTGGAGAVLSFGLADGAAAATALVEGLRLIGRSTAFGGTRSIIAPLVGPPAGRLRLAVGIEDAADIIADLDSALATL